MAETKARRRREVVVRPDGSEVRIAKPPRADVLWYPRIEWTTVLVRRTHNLELAQQLAAARWAEIGDTRPFVAHRVGWWTTTVTKADPAPDAALDQMGRHVRYCEDPGAWAAGPGIEFRP